MKKTLNWGILFFALLLLLSFAAFAVDTDPTNPTTSYDPTIPTVPTEPTTEPTGDHYADRAAVATVIKAIQNTRAAKNDVAIQLEETSECYKVTDSFGLLGLMSQSELDSLIEELKVNTSSEITFLSGVGNVEQVNGEGATETVETTLSDFFVPTSENSAFYNLLSGDFDKYVSNVTESHSEKGTQIAFTLSNLKFVLLNGRSIAATWANIQNMNGIANPSTTFNTVRISALINNNNQIRTIQVKTDAVLSGSISTDWGNDRISFSYLSNETAEFTYSDDETGDPETPTIRTGYCGKSANYVLDLTTGALEISGTGSIYDSFFANDQTIQNVIINDGITGIENGVFRYCTKIKSISIPASVSYFGQNILNGCSSLEIMVAPFWGNTTYSGGRFPLGYYFGTQSFTGAELVYQYYQNSYYYVPKALHTVNVISTPLLNNTFRECRNIKNVIVSDGTESIGYDSFYNCSSLKSVSLSDHIMDINDRAFYNCCALTDINIPSSVTYIGYRAFYNCSSLTEMIVPDNVTQIYKEAFCYCSALKRVVLPAGLNWYGTLFYGCDNIEELTAPLVYQRLTSYFGYYPNTLRTVHVVGSAMASYAFSNCDTIQTITLPDGLRRIPYRAFYHCDGLESIVLPKTVKVIDAEAFRDCVNLRSVGFAEDAAAGVPDATTADSKLKLIGVNAFRNCNALTEMTIPYFVGKIGQQAFYDCDALQYVVFAQRDGGTTAETPRTKLQTIGFAAFGRCELLESINMPFHVTEIGEKAFIGDIGLTKITIPRYVKTIGDYAFLNCRNVSEIEYCAKAAEEVNNYGPFAAKAKNYRYYYHGKFHPFYQVGVDTDGLTVTLTDTVRKVPDRLFYKNTALKKLVISAKVTGIGDFAFSRCDNLSKIVYQTKTDEETAQPVSIALSSIGYRAFSHCASLRSLYIPTSVKTIDDFAFSNCTKVGTIYYKAKAMNRYYSSGNIFEAVGREANGLTLVICNTARYVPEKLMYNNQALKTLSISQRAVSIGDEAFYRCRNLQEVSFAAAVRRTLTDLSFTRLTTIGTRAFAGCSGLTRIDIPESVEAIGSAAFANCRALSAVHFGTKDVATGTDVSLSRLQQIDSSTFKGCTALQSIIIPDGVTYIGWNAFEDCTHLKNVYFGSIAHTGETASIDTIDGYAFHNCKRMNWFKFPESVSTIGYGAFRNCVSLKKLNLPENISSVQSGAFEHCSRLSRITVCNAACVIDYQSTTFPEQTVLCAYANRSSARAYTILFVREFRLLHCDAHPTRTQEEIPAKCTEEGYTAGVYCEECEVWIEGHDTIPAHGHHYVVVSQIPATDTQEAALLYVCSYDHSHLLYEPIGSDHKPGQAVIENEVAATCTTPGSYDSVIYCIDCGKELSRSSVATAKAPHTPGATERKNEVLPTCEKDGRVTVVTYCAVCGNVCSTEQLTLPSGGHQPGAPKRENEVPATQTSAGSYEEVVYCGTCGKELSRTAKTIPALSHTHNFVPAETRPATCTETGEQTLICSICGNTTTETLPLAAHADSDNNGYCDACGAKMTGGDHCPYCGQIHGGAFGWLTKFFHSILALFGARK